MSNGSLEIKQHKAPDSAQDAALLSMTQNFLMYALERDDWLMYYLSEVNDHLSKEEKASKKPNLTIIQGGLSEA